MATLLWSGGIDGNFGTAGNWIDKSTGAASAAAPASDDVLVFPSDATVNVDAGLSQSAVDAVLVIEDDCAVNIGSPTAPLHLGSKDASTWTLGGSGSYYLRIAGDNVATGGTVVIQGDGTYDIASSGSEETADAIRVTNSLATLYLAWRDDEAALVDTLTTTGTVYVGPDVDDTSGIAAFDWTITGGTAITRSAVNSLVVIGGGATTLQCDIETLTQHGGTVTVLHGPAVTGTVSTATVHAGTLNYRGDRTITTLNIHADGAVNLDESPGLNAAITTVNIYGAGRFSDPHNANPVGTAFNLYGTDLTDRVNFGRHRKITIGSI